MEVSPHGQVAYLTLFMRARVLMLTVLAALFGAGASREGGAPGESRRKASPREERAPEHQGNPAARAPVTNKLGMEFLFVAPGEFDMGSPESEAGRDADEGPVHRVQLSKGYYLGRFEVTQRQWTAVMGRNPSHFTSCGGDCPVEQVSFTDVQEFIRRLNEKEPGRSYRLPTEAEWEYAARAGDTGGRYGDLDLIGWYWSNSRNRTQPAGRKLPNAWGFHDMIGNVWEWVDDWFSDYSPGPQTDPRGPSSGVNRVNRGGSWNFVAPYCRAAARAAYGPNSRVNYVGFRIVLNTTPLPRAESRLDSLRPCSMRVRGYFLAKCAS